MIFTMLWGKKSLKDTRGVNLACGLLIGAQMCTHILVYGAASSELKRR